VGRGRDADGREVGSPAIRPFLDRAQPRPPAPAEEPVAAEDQAASIRPYYLTRGRVASADARVQVETVVVARPGAVARLPANAREERRLLLLAVRPISVVELAVALNVPIGVVIVLAGDLARDRVLDLSTPTIAPRDDVALIRRLIDGVCAL
jgi:hypothetical protein